MTATNGESYTRQMVLSEAPNTHIKEANAFMTRQMKLQVNFVGCYLSCSDRYILYDPIFCEYIRFI